ESLLQEYNYTSKAKLLKDLQVSYFASVNSSQKIEKGKKENFDTLVLYLSAGKNAGVEVCKFASTGCRLACLVASGHALIEERAGKNTIAVSRIVKTWLAVYRKDIAEAILIEEIASAKNRAEKGGKRFSVRLNGTSDLEVYNVINAFPEVQFYDYTKDPERFELPNYHLTFSYADTSKARLKHYKQALKRGQSIAFPIIASDFEAACALPDCYSMDTTDLRFLDNAGKYGILKAKVTSELQAGVKNKFILSASELREVIDILES
ncbi:MAG TPA: hypothetical protein VMW25_01130, partial [Clostridia bacterium]|nr:hypothetical protein [Clostridia bacterium]